MAGGRPTLFKEEFNELIVKYAEEGLFLTEIATKFEVDIWTLKKWSKEDVAFSRSYARAKTIIISRLMRELHDMTHSEKKINARSLEFLISQMTNQNQYKSLSVKNISADKSNDRIKAILNAAEEEELRADELRNCADALKTIQEIEKVEALTLRLEELEKKLAESNL